MGPALRPPPPRSLPGPTRENVQPAAALRQHAGPRAAAQRGRLRRDHVEQRLADLRRRTARTAWRGRELAGRGTGWKVAGRAWRAVQAQLDEKLQALTDVLLEKARLTQQLASATLSAEQVRMLSVHQL